MPRIPRSTLFAMFGAAAVTAQFVAGKATRDALFLTSLDFTALPAMLIGSAIFSIALVIFNGQMARRIQPATLVPATFLVSAVLFLAEWALRGVSPSKIAILIYLHVSGAGPLLASGFWLISSERFDPRTAKRRFGQIAAAGTLGGLLSAVAAERIGAMLGAPAMLPALAVLQLVCAGLVYVLSRVPESATVPAAQDDFAPPAPLSGLRVIFEAPYLRNLAVLVLLGSTSAALVDYLFKAQAVETFGRGDNLLRFFAIYYAATSLLTFLLQASSSRLSLERFGIAVTAGTPSFALLVGSLGSLVAPGLGSLVAARGGESIFRSSLFRAGYELFYTPIPASEKRAAKALINVAFERLGDAVGGGLVRLAVVLAPLALTPVVLSVAVVSSLGALFAASRLNRGYIGRLEHSLINRAPAPATAHTDEKSTRALMRSILRKSGLDEARLPTAGSLAEAVDPEIRDIVSLRSRDRQRIMQVLSREEGVIVSLVPHVIPLLAWDTVAEHAVYALRKVAEENIGQLTDALIDPNQDFAIRRRLARVFSVCVSDRAARGLMLALDDIRFDVRHQAARALTSIVEKNPRVQIDKARIFEIVAREVAVGRPVWESRRLLEGVVSESPLDAFVRDRAGESLAHVFTLLGLVLPREPLQIAFRSLHTTDSHLQGTALEYLESVLPPVIRERLWPFLECRAKSQANSAKAGPHDRSRDEVIADLLRSNQSIVLNLEALRRGVAQ
jgi:ATP:ADP antiporter, AAA family